MTNDTLSSDVAARLRQRAALVDPAAADRIAAARRRTLVPSRAADFALAGSAAGAAGVGAIVAAAVTLSGSTPAFAGWTASPSRVAAAGATSATTACASQLASTAGRARQRHVDPDRDGRPGSVCARGARVRVDVRHLPDGAER